MSMLGAQIDELRRMGDGQAAIGKFTVATLLREAADTIESLRDRLQADVLGSGKLTAEQVRDAVEKHWHDLPAEYDMYEATALPGYSYDWQSIADELNATLGDDDYEHKMDALLCRLTNGKFSKSRQYSLDFMESCINEEFEKIYDDELAGTTLGNGTCKNEWERFGKFRCSNCWFEVDSISTNTTRPEPIRFCPNCGKAVRA